MDVFSSDLDDDVCKAIEDNNSVWILPSAVNELGKLIAKYRDVFGQAVLTTNFDPLLEVSILKHGGKRYRTVLHNDGDLDHTVSDGTHIVHLHGYWWGYDTLHTPLQLGQERPRLRRSLARFVERSTLVVLGYGGWDDVITRTLVELVNDSISKPEILWCFHESDEKKISERHWPLLESLLPGIGRSRVLLYRGIDCVSLSSSVFERLKEYYPSPVSRTISPTIDTLVHDVSHGSMGSRHVRISFDISLPAQGSSEPDSPLFVDPWVGRDSELQFLSSSANSVAFITGMGGQGKSALAGRFLQLHAYRDTTRFDFWDWRDCREENHRLHTQLLRLVERISDGALDASMIDVTDIAATVGVLFRLLQGRRALLVFDNVDQYVDLQNLVPTKGLDCLVAEAQSRNHQCLFLFTCRPDVRIDESRSVKISLTGLTEKETSDLLRNSGVARADQVLAAELHKITGGHPLWINLIAMQSVRGSNGIRYILDLISSGGATLPDTTRQIWDTLNSQ